MEYTELRKKGVYLGRAGEDGKRTVWLDVTAWNEQAGGGSGVLLYTSPKGQVWPLGTKTETDETTGTVKLSAPITLAETAAAGIGHIEAQWMSGGEKVKSQTFNTLVLESAYTGETVPDKAPHWVKELIEELNAAGMLLEELGEVASEAHGAYEEIRGTSALIEQALNTAEQTVAQAKEYAEAAEGHAGNANDYKTAAAASATAAAASAEQAMDATPDGYAAFVASMAGAYSAASGYAVGDYVLKDGQLYKCNTAIDEEGETWTAAHWTAVTAAGQLSQLSEEIDPLKSSFYTVAEKTDEINAEKTIFPFEFRVGNIKISDNGWVYEDSQKTRVSTQPGVTYHLNPGDVISLSDYTLARMYIGWKKDSDGTYGNTGAWKITDVVVADAGEYVINIESIPAIEQTDVMPLFEMLSITRADAGETIEEVADSVKTISEPGINLLYRQHDWRLVKSSVELKDDGIVITATEASTWVSAYIDIDTSNQTHIAISFDSISFGGTLPSDLTTFGKVRYGFVSDGTVSWKGWIESGTTIDVSSANVVRIALYISTSESVSVGAYAYYHNIQAEYGNKQSAFSPLELSAIDVYSREAEGIIGNHDYIGDRVILESPMIMRKCSYAVWKDFLGTEISDLSSYGLHNNQSMAIYGGYVFLFQNGGGVVILDFATKEILSTATLSQTASQHANSAQFTDVYYDSNDEFPLLFISRCGNSGTVSGTTDSALDALEVYRVQRSDNSFTFTLVKSIVFNVNTYGSSWGVDNNTRTLYVCYYLNGNWSITENNPVCFSAFKMPDDNDLKNAQTITFTESDVLYGCHIPFGIFQGMTVKNGIAYTCIQLAVAEATATGKFRHRFYAVDVFSGTIKSDIPFKIAKEPEGITIYNGKLYASQRNGQDTSGTNPVVISQFTF